MEKTSRIRFGISGIIIFLLGVLMSGSSLKTEKQIKVVLAEPVRVIDSESLVEEQRQINQSLVAEPAKEADRPVALKKVSEIPVLMYHSIAFEPKNDLRVPEEKFEQQMKFLKDNGYNSISMQEVYEILHDEKLSPEKPVVITFDDGYRDNYTAAFPILKKYNLKGTFFVITDTVDKGATYLNSSEILEMHKEGMDFQSHTTNHAELNRLTYDGQVKALKNSKEYLEASLKKKVVALAYPVGKYNSSTIKAAEETGYLMAYTTKPGFAKKKDGMFTLTRVRINASDSMDSFRYKIKAGNIKNSTGL